MQLAAETLDFYRRRPDIMVEKLFGVTPHPKQREILQDFPKNPRQAMCASKGCGKTTVEAWLAWNFLLTRPHPKIAATSISEDTLRDTLWTEMNYWQQKSKLLTETFTWTKKRIFANDHPETWWMSFRTWNKQGDKTQQANTLAGLHAEYIMFILDESGGIPDAVMVSADAALSACKEGHILQGGNPTHLEGPLYKAFHSQKNMWTRYHMSGAPDDPNRSPLVSIQWAEEQIKEHGRDNPWVLVNVFGQFPPSSFNSLIGPDEIDESINRRYREPDFMAHPRILGVDVARYGDDSSIIFPRQGLQAFDPIQYRSIDGTEGANRVAHKWDEWEADAVFVDNTGGFGSSWIDNLIRLGRDPIGIHFSGKPQSGKYFNKRTEMAFECVEWIKRGGAIPNIEELKKALIATTYTFKGDKLLLEPKEDIKLKIGYSPDHMDALCLTFALPITIQPRSVWGTAQQGRHQIEYNPLSRDKVLPELDRY